MKNIWQGRFDGEDPLSQRLYQKVLIEKNYDAILPNNFVLHGFAVDEGVRRNQGRIGAANAPDIIRKNMVNFPVIDANFKLLDFGNVSCENQDLEAAQLKLTENITKVLVKKGKSVVLGGGHEVLFPHYQGIKNAFPNKKIGIINIDAHFDNREMDTNIGPTSGTGFWQIASKEEIHSLHIGIQKNSNTLKLFKTAETFKMPYILSDEIYFENLTSIHSKIERFINKIDHLYLSICMDVFNASIAPGVSALAYNGIFADVAFMKLFKQILKSEKLVAMDVAEVNPDLDIQEKTSRLAASLINEWFMIN